MPPPLAAPWRGRSPAAADLPAARQRVQPSSSSSSSSSTASTSSVAASSSNGSSGIAPLTFDSPPHFADLPLDRAAALRSNEAELQRLLRLPTSRAVLVYDNKLLVAAAAAGSSNGSGSNGSGPLGLQPHSFAAAGAAAPGGDAPRCVPVVGSSQLMLQHQDQQQDQSEAITAAPTFLFLGRDAAGDCVFAALVPPSLLPLLPPLPPPRGTAAAQAAAGPADAVEQQQQGSAAAALNGGRWVDVRSGGQHMTGSDAAVAAYAGEPVSVPMSHAAGSMRGTVLLCAVELGRPLSLAPAAPTVQLAWRSGMPAPHSATARAPQWWVKGRRHCISEAWQAP